VFSGFLRLSLKPSVDWGGCFSVSASRGHHLPFLRGRGFSRLRGRFLPREDHLQYLRVEGVALRDGAEQLRRDCGACGSREVLEGLGERRQGVSEED